MREVKRISNTQYESLVLFFLKIKNKDNNSVQWPNKAGCHPILYSAVGNNRKKKDKTMEFFYYQLF